MPVAGDATDTMLRIGDKFPAIETTDLEGNPVAWDRQLLGKRYTLVVFWSTWCGFCMDELPHEVELAKKYEAAGLRVIGINADDTTELAKAAAKEHGVPWLNLFEGPDKTISHQLGVRQWPVLLLLDAEGVVVSSTVPLRSISAESLPDGSAQTVNGLDWTLRKLLDEPTPVPAPSE
jgi:thiol-disulfide isomerase/thioredoxin